nr:hypothetical protein [Microctonus hyperodae filamentous virus]
MSTSLDALVIIIPGLLGNELWDSKTHKRLYPPSIVNYLFRSYTGHDYNDEIFRQILSGHNVVAGKILKRYMGQAIYADIYKMLSKCAAIRQYDIVEFTYWMKPASIMIRELHDFIMSKICLLRYTNVPLIFIAHSFGGVLLKYLLQMEWNAPYTMQISKCFFVASPIFGQPTLFELFKNFSATTTSSSSSILRKWSCLKNEFFSRTQMLQLFQRYKHSLMLMLRYDDIQAYPLPALCEILEIDVNYAEYLLDCLGKNTGFYRKNDHIQYICVYNLKTTPLYDTTGKLQHLHDGTIMYTAWDLHVMRNTINLTQVRDRSDSCLHALVFTNRFILNNIRKILLNTK